MFCRKCGAQIGDGEKFCTSCGAPVEDGAAAQAAPQQAAPQQAAPAAEENYSYDYDYSAAQNPYGAQSAYAAQPAGSGPYAMWGLILGIFAIVAGILGAILFGFIPAFIALAAGIVGIIFSIKARKDSGDKEGVGGLVCSIIGVVFAAIFAIGCSFCSCGYGKWGCIGGSCKAKNDVQDTTEQINNLLQDLDGLDLDDLY
ncbi:MAG: zinc-ribbon domain-containing protein [Lachnospiraceae bacterium]|nr:zinc-ribbon domain-containing protein [Lachnospiraceae bacterium]